MRSHYNDNTYPIIFWQRMDQQRLPHVAILCVGRPDQRYSAQPAELLPQNSLVVVWQSVGPSHQPDRAQLITPAVYHRRYRVTALVSAATPRRPSGSDDNW